MEKKSTTESLDITKMPLDQLQALAYRFIKERDLAQKNLEITENMIAVKTPAPTITKPTEQQKGK